MIDVGFVVVSFAALPGASQSATTPGNDWAVVPEDPATVVVAVDGVSVEVLPVAGTVVVLTGVLMAGKDVPAGGAARCDDDEQPVAPERASASPAITAMAATDLLMPLRRTGRPQGCISA